MNELAPANDKASIPTGSEPSIGDRLSTEANLLASLPSKIGGGVINRLAFDAHHKLSLGLEVATGFAVAAGITMATRNPGLAGRVASWMPKVFLGATTFDLGKRFSGPMIDSWRHPADLERDKEWLGDNVGSALVDYPLVAASGFAGDKFASVLFAGSTDSVAFGLGSDKPTPTKSPSTWTDHLKLIGRHLPDAPVVLGANYLEQKEFPAGEFPNFPKTLNVTAPSSYADLKPGVAASIIPKTGFELNSKSDTATVGIHLNQAGPARLDIMADGPGTDWAKENDTSAVLSEYIDGKYDQDVVLWGGSKSTPYALSLGNLSAGNHTVTFRYADEKSAPQAQAVDLESGTATAVTYPDQTTALVDKYAPFLYGLNGIENNAMQTPLGMWDRAKKNSDGSTSITYGYFFSNENGGDGLQPSIEQAEWGRMTDIQTVLNLTVSPTGEVENTDFIGANDTHMQFKGTFDGTHPVIMDDTANNDVIDSGSGPILFKMPPDYSVPNNEPAAEIMNQNPQWWQTMYDEIKREGKVDQGSDGDIPVENAAGVVKDWFKVNVLGDVNQMADPRRYLYVQYDGGTAPAAAEVTLKNGRHYFSDFGVSGVATSTNYWNQTAVLLPKGTPASDISKVEFVSRGKGTSVSHIGRLFELNQDFSASTVTVPKV